MLTDTPILVLTRYLYIKEDVWASILMSILNKDYKQVTFWVCEMYYSGFKDELSEYLLSLYDQFFQDINPRLGKALHKLSNNKNDGAHILVSMAINMAAKPRKFIVQDFDIKHDDDDDDTSYYPDALNETRIIIHIQPESIEKYKTIFINNDIGLFARTILKQGCLYATCKNMVELFKCSHNDCESATLCEYHRDDKHWVYYASFSPIWLERILEYNGEINHETCCVIFPDEDKRDKFFNEYGYDPDEQSLDISNKIMHLKRKHQMTMKSLCCMFNTTKIIRVKRTII
jgi:hypothetical protein